jgi:hypothetical protein
MDFSNRWLLNHDTHSRVANSTASLVGGFNRSCLTLSQTVRRALSRLVSLH